MPFTPPLRIVDAHCDTLWTAPKEKRKLYEREAHGHLDLPRLQEAGVYIQFFALFSDPSHGASGFTTEALAMTERFYEAVEKSRGRMRPLLWRDELDDAPDDGMVFGLLSIEGAEPIQGRVDLLRSFFRLGVRAMGLTWNYRNELADGQLDSDSRGGLTRRGRAVVREMERLGMLIDCSHLSDAGFWDLVKETTGPIIASHSNARALCPHFRNLTDEQLAVIAERGGVIGINFYPPFLRQDGEASIQDVIRHIEYIAGRVGVRAVCLGSDFDGISSTPRGLEDCTRLPALAEELLRLGYAEADVRAIMGDNMVRLLKQVLPQRDPSL